jgi:organic hydroperoxide reductase OsmC/OhrA
VSEAHEFGARVTWEGNDGAGTSSYAGYRRAFRVSAAGKADLRGSAAAAFRGEAALFNPEELMLAALSSCHMLFYLALCARSGLVVVAYEDSPRGTLRLEPDGGGRFVEIALRPRVTLRGGAEADARALHEKAGALCFIANSCRVPIRHEVEVAFEEGRS